MRKSVFGGLGRRGSKLRCRKRETDNEEARSDGRARDERSSKSEGHGEEVVALGVELEK